MLEYRDTADGVNHSFFIVCYFYRLLQVFIKTTHHKNIILHDIITMMRFYSIYIYIDNNDDDDNDDKSYCLLKYNTYIDIAY